MASSTPPLPPRPAGTRGIVFVPCTDPSEAYVAFSRMLQRPKWGAVSVQAAVSSASPAGSIPQRHAKGSAALGAAEALGKHLPPSFGCSSGEFERDDSRFYSLLRHIRGVHLGHETVEYEEVTEVIPAASGTASVAGGTGPSTGTGTGTTSDQAHTRIVTRRVPVLRPGGCDSAVVVFHNPEDVRLARSGWGGLASVATSLVPSCLARGLPFQLDDEVQRWKEGQVSKLRESNPGQIVVSLDPDTESVSSWGGDGYTGHVPTWSQRAFPGHDEQVTSKTGTATATGTDTQTAWASRSRLSKTGGYLAAPWHTAMSYIPGSTDHSRLTQLDAPALAARDRSTTARLTRELMGSVPGTYASSYTPAWARSAAGWVSGMWSEHADSTVGTQSYGPRMCELPLGASTVNGVLAIRQKATQIADDQWKAQRDQSLDERVEARTNELLAMKKRK